MFSKDQKQKLAAAIETLLLDLNHPEMPTEKPMFQLHVVGKEEWSWADIEPNWSFDIDNPPQINPWNESGNNVRTNDSKANIIEVDTSQLRELCNRDYSGALPDNSFAGQFQPYVSQLKNLCDAYDGAKRRVHDLEYITANHCDRRGELLVESDKINAKLENDVAELKTKLAGLAVAATAVMNLLEQHGPKIVPHLLDTDDNAGQRLRDVLAETVKFNMKT